MAIQPPAAPMDPSMDPATDPSADGAGGDGSTEICIKVAADGSLSVYMEQGENEAGEDQSQPAADIGDALKQALDLYRQVAAKQGGDPQAQFDDGYKSGTSGATSRMGSQ